MGFNTYVAKGADAHGRGLPIDAMLAALEAMEAAGMSSEALASGGMVVVAGGVRLAPGAERASWLASKAGLVVFMPPGSVASAERDGASTLHFMARLDGSLESSALAPFTQRHLADDAEGIHPLAAGWLRDGERGKSSEALCSLFFGHPSPRSAAHPRDASDLRRCVQFLEATGTWERIAEAAPLSPEWAALAARWEPLVESLAAEMAAGGGSAPATCALMEQAFEAAAGASRPKP